MFPEAIIAVDRAPDAVRDETRLPAWVGYAMTVVIEAALTGLLLMLRPIFPLPQFPIPYVLATMLVAYFFGVGPAVLAFVLGLYLFDYFFVPPVYLVIPHARTPEGQAAIVAYLLGSSIVGFATLLVRRAKRRAERIAQELRENREDLARAQAVARTGSWRLDVRRNELLWSDEVYRIFGIPVGTPMTYDLFLASIHPDDREYVDRARQAALRGEPYDIEHRIIAGGETKWVRERAELEFTEPGHVLRGGFGTVQDITERKRSEEALLREQEHRMEFYQRTILAATEGKLVVTDAEQIRRVAGESLAAWEVRGPADISVVRHGVQELAESWGIQHPRLGELAVAVGEAVTNAIKHAKAGTASVHRTDSLLLVVVSDSGPGIPAMALPDVALRAGYSTAGTLGMGYKVMIRFADRVYLATGPEGTTVGVEMRIRPEGNG